MQEKKGFSIEGEVVENLRDVLLLYEEYGKIGESTAVNVRRLREYLIELIDLGTIDDSVRFFMQTNSVELKKERMRNFKTFSEIITEHVIKGRPYAYDKISLYFNALLNAFKWANMFYGCSFIVIDTAFITPSKKHVPPVKVIPLEEVDKLLNPSDKAMKSMASNPNLLDCLFFAQTILYTALRPSDAGALRRSNLIQRDGRWLLHSSNRKTGKMSFSIVPTKWAEEFIDRCENISLHDRPMTAHTEVEERLDNRKTVGSVKKKDRGKVTPYVEQKESMIFKYNQLDKIDDDDYYTRTYVRKLYKNLQKRDKEFITYLREVVKRCGLKFNAVVYRKVGNKTIKENFTDKDVTSYALRRTAITRMLSAGLDAEVVKAASGHSASSESFSRYIDKASVLMGDEVLDKLDKLNKK
jgi:integrase